ncbi:MAG: hypothetical protein HY002_20740 [Candidatus Rokubacteria bacterium]|nr:hypothetical protein [Candidatus Rokubacteria bacterium]
MNGVHRGLGPLRHTVAALVALGAAGCATAPGRPPPVLGSIPADQAEALVRRWETQWRQFPGLRAAVDLTVVRNGRAQRTAGVLLLSPTRLRYEAITPLGLPAVVVTAGPDRLLVFSLTERKAWTARPTAEAMSRWIGVPLRPETLIRLLAGQVPPPPEGVSVRVAPGADAHVEFEQGNVRQQVWVTVEGQPARLQLENGQRLTATFDRTINGQLVGLALEVPSQSLEVRLRYISGENTAPPPEAFEIVLPPGVPIEHVD